MSTVDLEQLKARLAKLGVHINDDNVTPSPQDAHQQQSGNSPLVQCNVERHNRALSQLLGRCARVQHAIQTADADSSQQSSGDDQVGVQQQREAAVEARQRKRAAAAGTSQMQSSLRGKTGCSDTRLAGKSAVVGRLGAAGGSTNASGADADAAAAQTDSKLLVRAAQRLLEDAQADAQHVSRNLKAAATGTTKRHGSAAAGTLAAAAAVDDLRNSPLGTVLAQYKEAQAAWSQEKAKLRREAVAARKEAAQVRLELSKVSRSSEHRAQEASCLKAALKGRDVLLEELQGRVRQLEDELARCQEVAAERLVVVSRERDDLQALLLATLERLEGVEEVVAAADATSAAMEEKVRVLETERLAALQTAATARQEVSKLQEARQRLELQSQLLEKLSKVQLQHNKRKSEALRELLAAPDAASDLTVLTAAGEEDNNSMSQFGCSKATAALRELLDELLNREGDPDEAD